MARTLDVRISRPDRSLARPAAALEVAHEHVAEVVASHGSTVLDVQHVGQVRSQRRRATAWLAMGGLMLLAGASVVGSEVSEDWEGYRVAHAEAVATGRPAPAAPGHGLGGLGFGLALLGLVPFGVGVVRRRDGGLDRYTLGESPDASFPVSAQTLPGGESFGLVQRHGDRYALGFTPQMRGEVAWSGHTRSLETLVSEGHTIASAAGHVFMLPDGARCRIEHEGICYRVATVARGRTIARRADADKPFWIYNAGSFAVLGTLLALMHVVPEDAMAMSLDELQADNRYVGYMQQPDLTPEEEQPVRDVHPEEVVAEAGGDPSPAAAGPSGAMGDPKSAVPSGMMASRGPAHAIPQLARRFDPTEEARRAGIVGVMGELSGSVLASPTGGAFEVGNDDADIWGQLDHGEVGAAFGVGGLGVEGIGRHGGGNAEGVIGFGDAGLIGKRGASGGSDAYGGGATIGHGAHRPTVPQVRRGRDEITGAVDKDAIRRTVRAHINEVRHCYNQGLARDPNLKGRVSVRFSIGPVGRVVSSAVLDDSLGDRAVGACVSKAVRRWTFPRPRGGGSAMVTYPFSLSPG